jgi:iron complex outermembrane recepter protein
MAASPGPRNRVATGFGVTTRNIANIAFWEGKMLQRKRNLLSAALASAIVVTAPQAIAQEQLTPGADEASELDRVTVTGIRRGIENAIETKQTSTSIVEAVSAEDIGKLPDLSIAESIARLPGLSAQRVAGRSSTIQIRGLSDDFGTALLNGREQVSVGHNRGVEFDQYPSELLSQVLVYKTPHASLVGQGLSGTVDLQTVRPLSFSERVVAFNLRGEKNSLGELNPGYDDTGYRFSASYIDQFMDGRFGLAVGFARLDSPGQANRWEAWGYPNDNGAAPGAWLIGGSKSQVSSTDNVRDGLMTVLEFKPNDRYHSVLDLYYSKFDKSETLRFMETGLGWSGATLSNAVIEGNSVVSGTFTGVRPVIRNDLNTQKDDLFSAGWNHAFQVNDYWTIEGDLSYSKAEREEMILETYSGLGPSSDPDAFDTVDFSIDRRTGLPTFSYGRDYADPASIVLTDPGGWGQAGFLKRPGVEDTLSSARLAVERTFDDSIMRSVEVGVNFAEREKLRKSGFEGFLRLPDGATTLAIPAAMLNDPADLSFTGVPGMISYDTNRVLGLYTLEELVHQDVRNKNWTVNEKSTTVYAQWNIDTDVGSVPVRGNIGVQYVRTDQSSEGFSIGFSQADIPTPMSGGAEYGELLPSMNLSFGLPADQMLRFGLGRQMARPRMDHMRANNNFWVDLQEREWRGNGGNPELRPWMATALDLSYEKYFGGRGYFALAAFHKDLHTWIQENVTVPYDFSGFDTGDLEPENIPPSTIGEFSRPENVNGGKLYGFEASLSIPFDLLWSPLEGFGIQTSYTRNKSSVRPFGRDSDPVTLPGLSERISNITLYYERYGFSARVSQRKRSDFRGEIQGFGGDRDPNRWIRGEAIVDMQLGYSFAEGTSLQGLSVLLQVNNLNNEPYREYFPDADGLPRFHSEYGRQVLLGLNYRF